MASNPLPVLPEVAQSRVGNVWATLVNARGRSLTILLPGHVLWPPSCLTVGSYVYAFGNWDVPAVANARIDVTYTLTDATKVVDVTDLITQASKEKAA